MTCIIIIVLQRVSSCSLKDVSLSEASKHGTLIEFAFFDKVSTW